MAPIILMVAEKPSICNSIAAALAGGLDNCRSRGRSPPIHEFAGSFQGRTVMFRVTSVTGHVFSVDFPSEFQNWESTAPVELFEAPVVRKPTRGSMVKFLRDEGKGVDSVVLWLDCDREGENICFEVLSCMQSGMIKRKGQQIYRAKFSAINPSDIKQAMKTLGEPNKDESDSVDARQELDLKVGVAFSRFQTRFFQGRYGDLDSGCISFGPCQTPTLGFCVNRHLQIKNFTPEDYWVLDLRIMRDGRNLAFEWERGRVFDQEVAIMFEKIVLQKGALKVTQVNTKETKRGRPTPMNTVEMLKAASKVLGIGPKECMHAAENLYLMGYLSYPRTESTAYPGSFDIKGTLREQQNHDEWGDFVRDLLRDGHTRPKGGHDAGDHPPITPMRLAQPVNLHGSQARIYDLVTRHFIATVSPDALFMTTKVQVECLGNGTGTKEKFKVTATILVDPGYLAIQRREEVDPDATLPEFEEGEVLSIGPKCNLQVVAKRTSPPGYLTESELIGTMERNGIGTDASIPTHIDNISKRNYVSLESGRRLVPTQLGIVLVQGYLRIDPDLVLPRVRSAIEEQCSLIAAGKANKGDVVEQSLRNFRAKFEYFCLKINMMDELFGTSFTKLQNSGTAFSRCGLTRRYLQYIEGPPTRLYNKYTEQVYSLPQGGKLKPGQGGVCPEGCNFELVLYVVGSSPPRHYPFCPYCFNNPQPQWGHLEFKAQLVMVSCNGLFRGVVPPGGPASSTGNKGSSPS